MNPATTIIMSVATYFFFTDLSGHIPPELPRGGGTATSTNPTDASKPEKYRSTDSGASNLPTRLGPVDVGEKG